MSKHLSSIKVEFPQEKYTKNIRQEDESNTYANEIFEKHYGKYLLNRTMEYLADSLNHSTSIEENIFESIKKKMDELQDPKFNLKIIKLLKEEIQGQTKESHKKLMGQKSVITMEGFLEH